MEVLIQGRLKILEHVDLKKRYFRISEYNNQGVLFLQSIRTPYIDAFDVALTKDDARKLAQYLLNWADTGEFTPKGENENDS